MSVTDWIQSIRTVDSYNGSDNIHYLLSQAIENI
jgi:hypothetical protein